MSVWGVGTGRCGTKSLAKDMGGLHEPSPRLGDYACLTKFSESAYYYCSHVIRCRHLMEAPIIVDMHHSYLIDMIMDIDSEAQFIWLIREPLQCVTSLLSGGAFTETDRWGVNKLSDPPRQDGDREGRIISCCNHWVNVNNLIMESVRREPERFRRMYTSDLQARENRHKASPDSLDAIEVELVLDRCWGCWKASCTII